jgi:ABC-type transport system involved in cytochrome c biogenesis permease subunit
MQIQSILFWTAVTLYAVATGLFFVWAAFKKDPAGAWGFRLTLAALVPHATSLLMRWVEVGHGPYSSRYEVLSANTFVLVVLYAAVVRSKKELKGLGAFVLPAAFLLMGWAVSAYGLKYEVPIIFKSYWLLLHIGFAKAFAATVLLAAGCAVAYLVKSGSDQRLSMLPAAGKLDEYSHKFLLVSFFFLGVMIAAGSLWAHQSWGRYWAWDPIETSSLAAWIAFGVILHFRVIHRWSGRRMAYLTLVAFAFSIIVLYIVTLVVPTIHNSYMVGQ